METKIQLLIKLRELFVDKEDLIFSGRLIICLTASSILFLNKCFNDIQYYPVSYHNCVQKLKQSISNVHTLKVVPGPSFKCQFVFDISCFQKLQVLEISKVPIGLIAGLQSLRAQIRYLITNCSIDNIEDVLALCGYDQSTDFAWPQLEQLDFTSNNLRKLDSSMRLLTSLKFLNLSRNNFTAAVEENWKYLPEITWLNISCNQLFKIPSFSDSCRGKITTLILTNNDLDDLEGLEILSNLEVLDVSTNSLTDFVAFRSLACLQKLVLFNCWENPISYHTEFRETVLAIFSPCLRNIRIVFNGRALTEQEMCMVGSSVEVDLSTFLPSRPYGSIPNIPECSTNVNGAIFQQSAEHSTSLRTNDKKKPAIRQPSIFTPGEEENVEKPGRLQFGNILESSEAIQKLEQFKKQAGEDYLVVRNLQETESSRRQLLEEEICTYPVALPEQSVESPKYFESPPLSAAEVDEIQDSCIMVSGCSKPITNEQESQLETLFVTVKDKCILEYDSHLKKQNTLDLDCLLDVKVVPMETFHSVQLRFSYVNERKRFRQYVLVDREQERSEAFVSEVKEFVRYLPVEEKSQENRFKCLRCSAIMICRNNEISNCISCNNTMLVDITPSDTISKKSEEQHSGNITSSLPHPDVIPKEVNHPKVHPDVCSSREEEEEYHAEYGALVSSINIKTNDESFNDRNQSAAVDIRQSSSNNRSIFRTAPDYSSSFKDSFISSSDYYDARSTSTRSSLSSQASTPSTARFPKVSFVAESCTHCDHRLKLHFETKMFMEEGEMFCCMIKCPVVFYGDKRSTQKEYRSNCLLIVSSVIVYICKITGFESVQPEDWLSLKAYFFHTDLRHIEYGLQSQSFRLEFAQPSACYTFLVGDSTSCDHFLKAFRGFLKKMNREYYTSALTVSRRNPQTLANVNLQVFGIKDETLIVKGQRFYNRILNFTHPPLIKNRKVWFRTLRESMLGREFIDWLIRNKEALNYHEAVQIGQSLLDAGIINCFDENSRFLEEHRYYHFNIIQQSNDDSVDNVPEKSHTTEFDTEIMQYFIGKCCTCMHIKGSDTSMVNVAIFVTTTHIMLAKENYQWPLPRYHEPPDSRSGPQFVFYGKQKITNISEMDVFPEHLREVEIEFHDEDKDHEERWRFLFETENSLCTFVEGTKGIWKMKFGVELRLNSVKRE